MPLKSAEGIRAERVQFHLMKLCVNINQSTQNDAFELSLLVMKMRCSPCKYIHCKKIHPYLLNDYSMVISMLHSTWCGILMIVEQKVKWPACALCSVEPDLLTGCL